MHACTSITRESCWCELPLRGRPGTGRGISPARGLGRHLLTLRYMQGTPSPSDQVDASRGGSVLHDLNGVYPTISLPVGRPCRRRENNLSTSMVSALSGLQNLPFVYLCR